MNHASRDIVNLTRLGTHDGGAQTAVSFLQELSQQRSPREFSVVAFHGTAAGDLAQRLGFGTVLIRRTLSARLAWERAWRNEFRKSQLCLTFHGTPWAGSRGYLVNVSGMADSNLFYPEIPFWRYCRPWTRAWKFAKDRGRLLGYAQADYWLFETETLAQRAVALGGYPQERTRVVKMAPSAFVSVAAVDPQLKAAFRNRMGQGLSFLFMASANPNKRIVDMGPALARLREQGLARDAAKVVTTLDATSAYYHTLARTYRQYEVDDTWVNVGPVPYAEVPSLIDACDVICLFSVLESFSSNITEAWAMRKPLLIRDADWARSACGDAATYVCPENPGALASTLAQLMTADARREAVRAHDAQLASYPNAHERCELYLQEMERARALGPLPAPERKRICKYHCRRMDASVEKVLLNGGVPTTTASSGRGSSLEGRGRQHVADVSISAPRPGETTGAR